MELVISMHFLLLLQYAISAEIALPTVDIDLRAEAVPVSVSGKRANYSFLSFFPLARICERRRNWRGNASDYWRSKNYSPSAPRMNFMTKGIMQAQLVPLKLMWRPRADFKLLSH